MNGIVGAIFGIGFLLYFAVCGMIVPVELWQNWQERQECEQRYNVFQCKPIVTWQPVKQDAGK